jgi:uncharacterized protein YecT (DUF1311 family)
MKLSYLFASIILLTPLRLMAAQGGAPDCNTPTSQTIMNRCAYDDFLAANGAQVKVLKGLTQSLAALDQKRLRSAQKSWIAWRTAECEFETGGSSGGSVHELASWRCAAKLTRERTLVLDKLANCPEGDIACPGRKP